MAINGLIRYNEIQKELSAYRKDSGIKFKASFQKTASQIYQSTKEQPLKELLQNIDNAYKNLIPYLPEQYFGLHPFFDYDVHAQGSRGIIDTQTFPIDLRVKAPQLMGEDWIGDSDDADYNVVFKDFSDYCNANKGNFWNDNDYADNAPSFEFEDIEWDEAEGFYYTTLKIDREDAYGYEPGAGAFVNKDVPKTGAKPLIEEEEPVKEEPTKPAKEEDKEFEIRKIQAETEKAKAETSKLSELNKAVASLRDDLKEGLITKAQYGKFLEKIYGV